VSAAGARVGLLCEGRSVPRSAPGELIVEVTSPARIDLVVGAPRPLFVSELTLDRTTDPASAHCDPAAPPSVLEVDAAQLLERAPMRGYFLQPQGLKLSRGLPVRIKLGPSEARRYELSVDGNDRYRLRWLRDGVVLEERLVPDAPGPGLTLQELEVPLTAQGVEVQMIDGDAVGSIGHLAPLTP
jgi:hypothetical protein